jgi:hypothetical protein
MFARWFYEKGRCDRRVRFLDTIAVATRIMPGGHNDTIAFSNFILALFSKL